MAFDLLLIARARGVVGFVFSLTFVDREKPESQVSPDRLNEPDLRTLHEMVPCTTLCFSMDA